MTPRVGPLDSASLTSPSSRCRTWSMDSLPHTALELVRSTMAARSGFGMSSMKSDRIS
jgi:hypothetical protein